MRIYERDFRVKFVSKYCRSRVQMNEQTKSVVSVAEMARMVGLSRQRFYQLLGGTFPYPLYDIATRRPFYTEEMQQVCLEVRKTKLWDQRQTDSLLLRIPSKRPQAESDTKATSQEETVRRSDRRSPCVGTSRSETIKWPRQSSNCFLAASTAKTKPKCCAKSSCSSSVRIRVVMSGDNCPYRPNFVSTVSHCCQIVGDKP